MNFFGSPNIEKMAAEQDYDGLYRLLQHREPLVQLQAAQALADLNDGAGWRFLIDTLRGEHDVDVRSAAAAMLGELGHPRAVPALKEVLLKLRFAPRMQDLADAARQALESIDSLDAEEALREAGYEPVLKVQSHQVIEYESHYARQVMTGGEVQFLSAEQHLNNAVELREAELTERGLVENSLALWLKPDWGYAWYLRGVLFEDLERSFEALLAYRRALALEPTLREAQEAARELQDEIQEELPLPAPSSSAAAAAAENYLSHLASRDWAERRDAAAALAASGSAAPQVGEALIGLLADEEREVRHAALDALGQLGVRSAAPAILAMRESSWMVRFSILQALSALGAVHELVEALRSEMARIQERNPIFSSQKDPLLEVEYESLMEIGARALERTGNLEALLELAEGNAWEDLPEEEAPAAQAGIGQAGGERFSMGYEEEFAVDDEEGEAEEDEDLSSYVDEAAEMVVIALGRLAEPALPNLPLETLTRLREVPDLTLLALEEDQDGQEPQEELMLVRDLNWLREAAAAELRRRESPGVV